MNQFTYARATNSVSAVQLGSAAGAKYLGGGTNLVDLMREALERPSSLVDVTHLSKAIDASPEGGLLIGAAARNTTVAEHPIVRSQYPVLTRAILAGDSG